MAYKEKFAQEAVDDVMNILDYEESPQRRQQFVDALDNRVEGLKKSPNTVPVEYKEFRVAQFVKIPFKLVYRIVKPSTLFILGIFHKRQHPDTWKDRADKY